MAGKRNNPSPRRGALAAPIAAPDASALCAVDDAHGLSLDQLSAAFAQLLSTGADPYSPAPSPVGGAPEAVADALDEETPEGRVSESGELAAQSAAADPGEVTPRGIVEAILFVGSPTAEGLSSAEIAGLMRGVRPAEVDALVKELNALYSQRGAACRIFDSGKGYRLELRPEMDRVRDKFYGRARRAKLSQSAIEVLSLVAYHEPIAAEEIDRLRSAASKAILSQLVRRELLQVERTAGSRQCSYSTTRRFLALFGLESTADLPKSNDSPA